MTFSVLMSIYHKEEATYFERSLISIWDEQLKKPDEIVLVEDGPLTTELYSVIKKWQKILGKTLKIVKLEKNVGLGNALNAGLTECSHELIARMDTDDIATPDRFKKQLKIFEDKDIDICSSWVSEFDEDENTITGYRIVPKTHQAIIRLAKIRSPLNHPAVMYKKSAILNAGGYEQITWFEDYFLWIKMIMNGATFYNIQEPLVKMHAGHSQILRRAGIAYAKSEYEFQKRIFKLGFLNRYEFIRNTFIRFVTRIVPKRLTRQIYKLLRKY